MTWEDLLHDERYLGGEVLCIGQIWDDYQIDIKGTEEDFGWVNRPEMVVVCKGPVQNFAYDELNRKFCIRWHWLEQLGPGFESLGRMRSERETGTPDLALLSACYQQPKQETRGLLYLGTEKEGYHVYLLPQGYTGVSPQVPSSRL
jgi:hypothetical protein